MYQIIEGGVLVSDLRSLEKSNRDLVSLAKKLEEGNRKFEKKIEFQSSESGNNFETIIKNHGEF